MLCQCAADVVKVPSGVRYASRGSSDREPEYGAGEGVSSNSCVVIVGGWLGVVARSRPRRLG